MAGEEQHHVDFALRRAHDGDDARGVDRLALRLDAGRLGLGALLDEAQDARRGVVVVQQFGLRGLADQLLIDAARRGDRVDHDVPLRGVGQRHVQVVLQAFEAEEGHPAAVAQ